MKNIVAIIPVKKNSSRLPNKNILPFGETNMLAHKIRQLKKVKSISRIIVSTDSEEMIRIAKNEGVEAYLRPEMYANESLPIADFIVYLSQQIQCDYFVWACVTSPLVDERLYEKALEIFFEKEKEGYDSLVTVIPFQHYLMKDDGPFNFSRGKAHPNSQSLPKLYLFTNGIQISPHYGYAKWGDRIGEKPYLMIIDKNESIDIDDAYDYEFAKAIYEMKKRH